MQDVLLSALAYKNRLMSHACLYMCLFCHVMSDLYGDPRTFLRICFGDNEHFIRIQMTSHCMVV